jgi:ubiquinone/menaquinone biosynthesis C-methylase UbiE
LSSSTTRFSSRVENYIKYRPGYPPEIIDYLTSEGILKDDTIITDIGSGTGISAEIFLNNGNTVYCVEPNKEMREAAERLLEKFAGFVSVNGTAENTALQDKSIDLIICAQAFHWFDIQKAKAEFKRILKPAGRICLMWNERKLNATPFLTAYEELLNKYGTDYKTVRHENIDDKKLAEFFENGYTVKTFANKQVFNYDGVKGRLLSSSYAPLPGEPGYEPMMIELKEIFDKFSKNGVIEFLYDTNIYINAV